MIDYKQAGVITETGPDEDTLILPKNLHRPRVSSYQPVHSERSFTRFLFKFCLITTKTISPVTAMAIAE